MVFLLPPIFPVWRLLIIMFEKVCAAVDQNDSFKGFLNEFCINRKHKLYTPFRLFLYRISNMFCYYSLQMLNNPLQTKPPISHPHILWNIQFLTHPPRTFWKYIEHHPTHHIHFMLPCPVLSLSVVDSLLVVSAIKIICIDSLVDIFSSLVKPLLPASTIWSFILFSSIDELFSSCVLDRYVYLYNIQAILMIIEVENNVDCVQDRNY